MTEFIQPERHHDKPHDPDFFVIKDGNGLAALKYWLKTRRYNHYVPSIDRNGSFLIGLIYDFDLGTFPSTRRQQRGLICIANQVFEKPAIKLILKGLVIDTPHGKQWKERQVRHVKQGGSTDYTIRYYASGTRIIGSRI